METGECPEVGYHGDATDNYSLMGCRCIVRHIPGLKIVCTVCLASSHLILCILGICKGTLQVISRMTGRVQVVLHLFHIIDDYILTVFPQSPSLC